MDIAVLAYEDCLGVGLVGAVDILSMSRRMLGSKEESRPFRVYSVSHDGMSVRDGGGRRQSVDKSFETLGDCAAVIVPGFMCDGEHAFPPAPSLGAAASWLRRQHAMGAIIAGSCNGVFLLGEAGLLDGRRCTTTWWRHNEMKARYPRADAAWGAALINDRRVITAGGPFSWIELSLHVIRVLCGPEAAKRAADFTVVDTVQTSQSIFVPQGHLSAADPFLTEAERIVRQMNDTQLTAVQLARELGLSERTLHRRLKDATGETPKSFLDRVRFETARTLLETTSSSVKQLAAATGYQDETSFRRAFRRYSGMTPGAYRSWSEARRAKG